MGLPSSSENVRGATASAKSGRASFAFFPQTIAQPFRMPQNRRRNTLPFAPQGMVFTISFFVAERR